MFFYCCCCCIYGCKLQTYAKENLGQTEFLLMNMSTIYSHAVLVYIIEVSGIKVHYLRNRLLTIATMM